MIYRQLQQSIYAQVGDLAGVNFSDTELFEYFKDGCSLLYDFVVLNAPKTLYRNEKIPVAGGRNEADLPQNVYIVEFVFCDVGSEKYKMQKVSYDFLIPKTKEFGLPYMWDIFGTRKIIFAPTPSNNITLDIYYIPVFVPPQTMDADSGLPSYLRPFLLDYIALRAKNRIIYASVLDQQFLSTKGESLRKILSRMQDSISNFSSIP